MQQGQPNPSAVALSESRGQRASLGEPMRGLCERSFPAIEAVCGPLTTSSISLVSGAAGVGKSLWTLDMASHIAAGMDFESWTVPKPRTVLYVDGEMSGADLQVRLRLMQPSDNLFIMHDDYMKGFNQFPDFGADEMGGSIWQDLFLSSIYLAENDVFIFDTVSSLVGCHGDFTVWTPEYWMRLNDFNRKLRSAGKTVIWVDHTNRDGKTNGTMAKGRTVDNEFTLAMPVGRIDNQAGFDLEVVKQRNSMFAAKSQWRYESSYGWKLTK